MLIQGKGPRIDKLLPKNGEAKGDYRLDLVSEPLERWDDLVAHMSLRTTIAVTRFRIFYVERHLLRYQTA